MLRVWAGRVDQLDRGWAAVAGAVVPGPFDAIRVVAGSFDDPRVGAVPALGVEVLFPGDFGHDRGKDAFPVLRGGRPPGQRPGGGDADGALELRRPGPGRCPPRWRPGDQGSLTGGNRNDVTQLMPLIEAIPPVRGRRGRPRRRPDRVYADRGYDHDKYRQQVRAAGITPSSRAAAPSMAPGWACTAGSWSRASPCCTGSAGCASAGRSATTSTKPSSASPATSSAGADWPTSHFVRSS